MSDNKTKKGIKLSTEAYKGVRDFYPEDMFVQNFIFGKMREAAESFGFQEYEASVLEPAELYKAKSGEEIIAEQTYTFIDRGDREVTLRPEMTPTVARMVAAKRQELAFPLRWYSIPNLFRYEKPQRGRLREHWQLNADIFGVSSIEAEVEIISMAYNLMKSFGANTKDFTIRLNDRKTLTDVKQETIKLIDKKNKISLEEFSAEWNKLETVPFEEKFAPSADIKTVLKKLAVLGIENVAYDPGVVRGFDYYTGIVFEVFDTSPNNRRSLFGGGRYDNLTELFGGDPVPAVGFGMGDVTIRDFLETRNLIPEYTSATNLSLCVMKEEFYPFAEDLAKKLRNDVVNVSIDFSGKKIGDQIKSADKQKIPFIICIGDDEVKNGEFKLKNLKTGEERVVALEKISSCVK